MAKKPHQDLQGDLFAGPAGSEPAAAARANGLIDREALLARLVRGHGERLTVITPSLRLAQALEADVDARQVAAGRAHWEAPDILAFGPFVRRCYDEALYGPAGTGAPVLLSDPAAQLLWEEAIRASPWRDSLLSIPATASLAAEAWLLAHAWRIDGALRTEPGSEDAEAFATWAEHYARRLDRERMTDTARLPAVVAALVAQGSVARPATLVAYAFDRMTPQQSDFIDACERAGVVVLRCDAPCFGGHVSRVELEAPRAELEHAARWARSRLEAASGARAPRIAVVVPDLAKRRREVARVFARVLGPDDGAAPGAPLFNISLGEPLSSYPLVDAALALVELASGPVEWERASRLVRSPFIAGAEAEQAERGRLDAALRRVVPASLTLMRLRQLISHAGQRHAAPACAGLTTVFDRLIDTQPESGRAPASEWARRFTAILDAAGFPGERTLDSTEYQALGKWRETLADLAALNPVAGEWTATEARSRLQRLCGDTVFQPRSGSAPVQVLGLLESVGLAFEHLWVSGLTEASWPIASRPHPLIAPSLQRRAGIPQASPEEAFKVDQAITRAWRRAAPEVVFSSARTEGDRELLPSPLVADVPLASADELAIAQYPMLRDLLFRAGREPGAITAKHDYMGPAVEGAAAKGGTRILVDQAACPFRAFAHFRLDARALEHPEPGLGPMDRGTLLHAMMATLWEALKDSTTLHATDEATLAQLIDAAAADAIKRVHDDRPGRLEGRFAELERERLAGIAREWLAIEMARPAFRVTMREESMPLAAGGLLIDGRIDRVDHLEGGGLAVIDYKTGSVRVGAWMGERPDDAQLPLYALAAEGGEDDVRAVAYARLKTGDRGFSGVARSADVIPGVQAVEKLKGPVKTWDDLLLMWRREVDLLGDNFAAGHATVDPKALLSTCRWCDLKPLCRVHERLTPLDEGDEDESAEEES